MASSVEVLIDPEMATRGRRMIEAMIEACPIPAVASSTYTGACDLLLTYGTGHPLRRPWWKKHRKTGRHCIGLDLGYWGQDDGAMRVTVDEDHPQAWIREESPERWEATGIQLRSDFDPAGPAVIVGMGRKALPVHGLRPLEWEGRALSKVLAMGMKPVFRPKRSRYPVLPRVTVATGKIEQVLKGAGLVICRHSNVAVDACIAGIPVICEDGAAYALYKNNRAPTYEQRLAFLQSLAWWNWRPEEAKELWTYLLSRLSV